MSSEYFSSWRPRLIDREAGPGTVHVLPKPGPQGKDLNNLPRSYRLPAEGCQAGQSWHSRNLPLDDISGCTVTHFGNQQVISSTELQESDDGAHKRIIKRYYTLGYRCREIYIPSDIIHEIKAILKADRMDLFQRFLGWYTCEGHTFQFYSVYFAMEYFESGHLGQFMGATWLKINARSITEQLLKGLSVLHSREIFHPNMEPKHVLIASWDPIRVKIGGLERSIFKQEYVLGQNLEWLCYQIPEIEFFASVGSKAKYSRNLDAMDMWTLGCLLYEMLFSKPPCCCGVLQSCKCMGLSTERSISIPWSFDDCGLRNIDFPIDLLRDSSVEEIKQNHGDFRIHEVVVNVQYGFKNNNRGGIEWSPQAKWIQGARIGSGGYGTVWLQRSPCGSHERAVKVFQNKYDGSNLREIEILTMVSSRDLQPYFVKFMGWYEELNSTYIAMEYIKDGDLSKDIGTPWLAEAGNTKEITKQLLEGLSALHSLKICHRDIKPPNVLIASRRPVRVKIADFGFSKHQTGTVLRTADGTEFYSGTALRTAGGTEGYSAPETMNYTREEIKGLEQCDVYTEAADMWSLGCLLYVMLTSELPFFRRISLDDSTESGIIVSTLKHEPDVKLLIAFCNGRNEILMELLEKFDLEEWAVELLQELLVPHPEERIPAERALTSRCFQISPRGSDSYSWGNGSEDLEF